MSSEEERVMSVDELVMVVFSNETKCRAVVEDMDKGRYPIFGEYTLLAPIAGSADVVKNLKFVLETFRMNNSDVNFHVQDMLNPNGKYVEKRMSEAQKAFDAGSEWVLFRGGWPFACHLMAEHLRKRGMHAVDAWANGNPPPPDPVLNTVFGHKHIRDGE